MKVKVNIKSLYSLSIKLLEVLIYSKLDSYDLEKEEKNGFI